MQLANRLDEDVIDWILKQAADGDKEATFEFDCDNWLTIDMPDMINILLELSTKVDTVKAKPYDEETVCPECGYDSFVIKNLSMSQMGSSLVCVMNAGIDFLAYINTVYK